MGWGVIMNKTETRMGEKRWLEAGIFFEPEYFTPQNTVMVCWNLLAGLDYPSWHYFRVPNYELKFRILASKEVRNIVTKRLRALLIRKEIKGITFREYHGEDDMYGKVGYLIALKYFNSGADIASLLVANDERGKLMSPYKGWSPIHFHLNRYVHLFADQLGYSVWDEFKWAIKYAWNRLCVWVKYRTMGVKGR